MVSPPKYLQLIAGVFIKWWLHVTEPHPAFIGVVERARARLLSSMTLCLLFMALSINLVILARPSVFLESWFALIGGLLSQYLLYRLSRTPHYHLTAGLTLGIMVVGVSYGALIADSRIAATTGMLLVIPILLSVIIWDGRATAVIVGIGIALGVYLLIHNTTAWLLDIVLLESVILMSALLIGIFNIFRRYVDDFRRAEIHTMNSNLLAMNAELRQARDIAEENTRLKTQFLANMSHELRTPLTAIIGYTDLQLMGITGEISPKQREYLERIQFNGRHLISMINEVLDLSRIEAGRLELHERGVVLAELVNQWRSQTEVLARTKGLRFALDLDPALPPVIHADPDRLTQIALNLLSNAIKFTETGRVDLALQRDGQHWHVCVSDTGIGIPPEAQAYIFDEFRQVDSSATRPHDGTGLGLAIVRRLSQLMGGQLMLTSTPGSGSVFTVVLPLKIADQPTTAPSPAPAASALARVMSRPGSS
jgi:signal transduction histidine kinase